MTIIEIFLTVFVVFFIISIFCNIFMPNKENYKKAKNFFEIISIVTGCLIFILLCFNVNSREENLSKISRDETRIFMASNSELYERNFKNRELLSLLIAEDEERTTIRRVDDKVLLTVYLKDRTEIFFISNTLLNDTWWFEYHPEVSVTDRIYIAK